MPRTDYSACAAGGRWACAKWTCDAMIQETRSASVGLRKKAEAEWRARNQRSIARSLQKQYRSRSASGAGRGASHRLTSAPSRSLEQVILGAPAGSERHLSAAASAQGARASKPPES